MSASKGSHSKDHPNRTKQYVVAGVIIVILVAALLIWNSGIFQKHATAAVVGETKISTAEMDYYYHNVANSFINNAYAYAQYGVDTGYDISLEPEEQYYSKDSQTTYAQHFMDTALDELQRVTLLTDQAGQADYTLSDEGKAQVDATLNQLTMYSVQSGYSKEAYLRQLYGENISLKLYKQLLEKSVLADEFAKWKADEFTYSDQDLSQYYEEHKDDLDTYDYRYCYVYSDADTADSDKEPTEEETAAALAEAERKANQMASRIRNGEDFNTVAQDYTKEETAAKYAENEDYAHNTDTLGSALSSTFATWLKDSARKAGELTVVESDNGYCVVQFLGRSQRDDIFETVDLRSILVTAETTPTEVDSGDKDEVTGQPVMKTVDRATEEQLAAAKTKAEDLLAQFTKGEATAEAFGDLAKENSDDADTKADGGVLAGVTRSDVSADASAWAFAAGQKIGSTTIVEVTDNEGNVTGYQILFLEGVGMPQWKFAAKAALSSADYEEWYNSLKDQYKPKYVGPALQDKVAAAQNEDNKDDASEPTDENNNPEDENSGSNPSDGDSGQGDNGGDANAPDDSGNNDDANGNGNAGE